MLRLRYAGRGQRFFEKHQPGDPHNLDGIDILPSFKEGDSPDYAGAGTLSPFPGGSCFIDEGNRTHVCDCGYRANRDYVATRNILRVGLDTLAVNAA